MIRAWCTGLGPMQNTPRTTGDIRDTSALESSRRGLPSAPAGGSAVGAPAQIIWAETSTGALISTTSTSIVRGSIRSAATTGSTGPSIATVSATATPTYDRDSPTI